MSRHLPALRVRLDALEARLDARRRAEAAGQLALDLTGSAPVAGKGPGGGEKCGAGWIDPKKTCRKGEGGAPIDPPDDTRRGRPVEPIGFDPPLKGPSGAELLAYEWQWMMDSFQDSHGEEQLRRVSNWELSEQNAETGRRVVHQFKVRKPDGSTALVSSETAVKILGFATPDQKAGFRQIRSTAQTIAKLEMEKAQLEQEHKRIGEIYAEIEKQTPPEPQISRNEYGHGLEWVMPGSSHAIPAKVMPRRVGIAPRAASTPEEAHLMPHERSTMVSHWQAAQVAERLGRSSMPTRGSFNADMHWQKQELDKRIQKARKRLEQQAAAEAGRSDATDRIDSLLTRLDALKRRCSTGYACGNACISVKKECRSQGGAGSRERIQRLEQLARGEIKPRGLGVPKAADAKAMAKKLRAELNEQQALLKAERKRQQAASANDVQFDISQSVLKRVDTSGAISAFESQELVYEDRGYNAKPEVVGTRQDLAKRSDLIQDPGGRPTILVRGVTNDDDSLTTYVEDFKRGDKHYVGWGNWGNGTYAASGIDSHLIAFEYTGLKSYSNAKETHGSNLNQEANKSVMTFGIKKSATVVQCSTMEEYQKFQEETIDKANQALRKAGNTSNVVSDLGLAAAIVGIDAYSLPAPSEFRKSSRYWVVLNRGAVVVAEDGQWT